MESIKRSLIKSASYRLFGLITTGAVAWMFTRDLSLALGVGIADTLAKLGLFYFHERAWLRISYGRPQHPLQKFPVSRPLSEEHEAELKKKLSELGYLGENI